MRLLSHEELDAARQVGDPPADALAQSLGRDAWVVNAALRHLHDNGAPLPDATPRSVRDFFETHVAIPSWADARRIRRAQQFASRHLFHVTVSLFCASLPISYAAERGARVLVATGRMQGDELDKRVNETAQFILDIVAEDGFGPRGSAVRAIQKVRLVHAAVRTHLQARGFDDSEVAINQEDQLGTLFSFSALVIRSLRKLGVQITDTEADDYHHLWHVVGAMLGIREDLLPPTYFAAHELGDRISARQLRGSEHGRLLMKTLLAGMEAHVPHLRAAPRHLVRHLIGDRLADELGVPGADAFRTTRAAFQLLPRLPIAPLGGLARRLTPIVGRPLLEAVVAAKLGGIPPTFAMPERVGSRASDVAT
ncbi:MAG TPA: oxygenase MpaB family protein [Polyangiaceae bacterium]|jgi:hypothetical protein|nr:oxygenase MpaB family protein [Polyangiaceae bacterium]